MLEGQDCIMCIVFTLVKGTTFHPETFVKSIKTAIQHVQISKLVTQNPQCIANLLINF